MASIIAFVIKLARPWWCLSSLAAEDQGIVQAFMFRPVPDVECQYFNAGANANPSWTCRPIERAILIGRLRWRSEGSIGP
jgi:hypothetical protein